MTPVMQALQRAAASPNVLVASDYDGTLAPIVADPDRAFPDTRAMRALASLAELPGIHAAILSGRQVSVLEALSGGPVGVKLVGSHGAEQADGAPKIDGQLREELAEVRRQLASLCEEFPGARLEAKPTGVAFHYRNVESEQQSAAESAARRVGLAHPELALLEGKMVVEFAGSAIDKGDALLVLRDRTRAEVIVFIGDDVTDENAFAALRPVDVGVKVGPEPTRARFRVDDQAQVAEILEALLAFRLDRSRDRNPGC
jgi:trehalose-phosphatase